MAFVSERIARFSIGDAVREVYRLFFTAVQTGNVTLSSGFDLRKCWAVARDLSTAGTVLATKLDIETGVLTVDGAVADNAFTGESGGAAGTYSFTATGAVTGQTISGTGVAANTMVVDVDSTTVGVDLALTAGVGTDIVGNTAAILVVDYYN